MKRAILGIVALIVVAWSLAQYTPTVPTQSASDNSTNAASTAHVKSANLAASQITSGTVALARGGTNADLSASGSATAVLAQDVSHVVSARSLVAADIPNTVTATGPLGGFFAGFGTGLFPYTAAVTGVAVSTTNEVRVWQTTLLGTYVVNTVAYVPQTTASGKFMYIGIYDSSGNRLTQGNRSMTSGSGAQQATTMSPSVTLHPGVYYIAMSTDNTTLSMSDVESPMDTIVFGMLNGISGGTYQATAANGLSGGSLPSTLGMLTQSGVEKLPILFFYQ